MDLSIIIVNWNSSGYLEKCLGTVYENTRELEFEVIVVDNASFDGCDEMLGRRFPQVKFIQSVTNLGFSGANNLGFLRSSGRAVLFLNPDTELDGNAIGTLFAALERTADAAIVGARLLNSDGSVQTSCIQRFPSIINQVLDADVLRGFFPKSRLWATWPLFEKQTAPLAVEVISGACLMMKRSVFEQVGLFTTEYFMYSEDVDLCYKAREAGYQNYYIDDAIVVHHGGGSTEASGQSHFASVVMRESIWRFLSLRRGRLRATMYRITVVAASLLRCILLFGGVALAFSNQRNLRNALERWIAILRWGIGLSGHTSVSKTRIANASGS